MLVDGRLDLGMAFAPALLDEVRAEPIFEEDLVLVRGLGHAETAVGLVATTTLNKYSYAFFAKGMATRRIIDDHLAAAGIAPVIGLEMNTVEGLLRVVESSDLATIMPARSVEGRTSLHVARIVDPTPRRQAALLWARGGYAPPVATAFADLLKVYLKG